MFSPVSTRIVLVFAIVVFTVVGCQQQSGPDTKAAATAKTKEVAVEITGMT